MVTLQVLVLSFWVRIPVTQHEKSMYLCAMKLCHRYTTTTIPTVITTIITWKN